MTPRTPRYAPTVARVNLVLDAAILLAADQGWEAVTPSALARATGVSRPEISAYLGGKTAIFQAVGVREMRRINAALADVADLPRPHQQLRAVVSALLADRSPPVVRAVTQNAIQAKTIDGVVLYSVSDAISGVVGPHAPTLAAAWMGILRHSAQSPSVWTLAKLHAALYRAGLGFLAPSQKGPTF